MGRHDEAMNLLDNSKFVKLAPGLKPRLRLLDDPYVSNRQYQQRDGIKTVFSWPVWDYATQSVKILEKGKSIKDQIDIVEEIYGFAIPAKYDIIISTTGEGMQTKYRVDGMVPIAGPLPGPGELDNMLFKLDLPKSSRGIPIGQVRADNMPQVQIIEGKAGGAESNDARPPSAADYARARAEEAAAINQPASEPDTVITELPEDSLDLDRIFDPDGLPASGEEELPVNTDDIPFKNDPARR